MGKVKNRRVIRRGTRLIVGNLRNLKDVPIIFLDIDGVLNSVQYVLGKSRVKEYSPYRDECCNIAMSNLIRLMDKVDNAHIVVSSTWRISTSITNLRIIFKSWGMPWKFRQRVIAKTPVIFDKRYKGGWKDLRRGSEIDWFCKRFKVNNYVIIDDDGDMLAKQKKRRFVQTDGFHGFMFRDYMRCREILTGKKVDRRNM